MDSRSTPKLPPPTALITPSASPPVSRSLLHLNSDHHSRKKRQRIASSSSQPPASSPLSKQTQEPDFDLHSARRDASLRVLDVWSHLADRYSRRLDEDDIVDLRTVSFVKDRGVIRASPQKFQFGCFSQDNDPSATDASSDGAPEDELDELDALALEGNIPDEIEKISQNIPPLQVMDPADAEDLRQFLEAENQRKKLGGNEDDISSEESDRGNHFDDQHVLSASDDDLDPEEVTELTKDVDAQAPLNDVRDDDDDDNDEDNGSNTLEHLQDQEVITDNPPELTDVESDDELGGWGLDEGNAVYPVRFSSTRPRPKLAYSSAETPIASTSASSLDPAKSSHKTTESIKKRNSKVKPQVIIITPKFKKAGAKETRAASLEHSVQEIPGDVPESDVEFVPTKLPPSAKDKGKGKSVAIVPERMPSSDSDDPITLLSSESPPKLDPEPSPLWKNQRKSRLVRTFSGRARKRKRVWSSSELSETERSQIELPEPSSPAILPDEMDRDTGLASASTLGVTTGTHVFAPSKTPPNTITKLPPKDQPRSQPHLLADLSSDPPIPDRYPYSQLHTPQHEHTRHLSSKHSPPPPPPPFYPIQDPRAQYIISQAMHQLSCLMTGMPPHTATQPWPPPPPPPLPQHDVGYHPPPYLSYPNTHWPPYTPTHHHPNHPPYPSSSSRSSSPVYSTPTHPRPHPHPHSYDPSLSNSTLPPSSPDPPSSSPPRADTESSPIQERPKSLVPRSKSRGRRVSFRLDDDDRVQRTLIDGELDWVDDQGRLARSSSSLKSTLFTPDMSSQASPSKQGRGRSSSRRIASSPHPEFSPPRSAGKGKRKRKGEERKKKVQKHVEHLGGQGSVNNNDDDDLDAWLMYNNHHSAESVRGRRFVRGQTPGPPSRAESSRPATPPGTTGRGRSASRGDVFGNYGSSS